MSAIELTNAEAVHPGYGFLSEKANFAKILEENKIKFIGPSSKLVKMMGDKIEAKKIAKKYGLPVIEGSEGGVSNSKQAKEISKKIGFPVTLQFMSQKFSNNVICWKLLNFLVFFFSFLFTSIKENFSFS